MFCCVLIIVCSQTNCLIILICWLRETSSHCDFLLAATRIKLQEFLSEIMAVDIKNAQLASASRKVQVLLNVWEKDINVEMVTLLFSLEMILTCTALLYSTSLNLLSLLMSSWIYQHVWISTLLSSNLSSPRNI